MDMVAPLEVGICCTNIAVLKNFYVQHLGFREISSIEVPAGKACQTGLTSGAYQVVRLQSPWGERLKLLQPAAKPARRESTPEILACVGTTYLTFIIDDLQGMLDRLRALNAQLLSGDNVVEVRPGVFLVFAKDPEGNILEFVKYANLEAYRPELASMKDKHDGN